MSNIFYGLTVLVLGVVLGGQTAVAERVPALMWTNDESVEYPQVLAGHTVSTNDFKQLYLDPLLNKKQGNIVLFVQDKLSVADISHYANVYGYDVKDDAFSNVKSLMSDLTSTHLPNVLSPQSALTQLKTVVLAAPYDVSSLNLAPSSVNVIVVRLPRTKSEDYVQSLRVNDQIIGSVSLQLEGLAQPFYAIYTAMQPTKTASELHDAMSPKRNLLAADSSDASASANNGTLLVNVSNAIYLYTAGISMASDPNAKDVQSFDLLQFEMNDTESYCAGLNSTSNINDSCVVAFSYKGSQPLSSFALRFSFGQSVKEDPGYWTMTRMEMTYSNNTEEQPTTVDMNFAPISDWTPLGLSYSCSAPEWVGAKNKTQHGVPYLKFKSFQVQAFGIKDEKFGHYNDCEGFFGIGIWMALICIAVMIAILVFGLLMLSDITTMDRYDDPKGKTIIVATGTD